MRCQKNFVCFFCCLAKKIPESKCLNLQDLYQSSWKKFNYFYLSFLSHVCLKLYNAKKEVFSEAMLSLHAIFIRSRQKQSQRQNFMNLIFVFYRIFSESVTKVQAKTITKTPPQCEPLTASQPHVAFIITKLKLFQKAEMDTWALAFPM